VSSSASDLRTWAVQGVLVVAGVAFFVGQSMLRAQRDALAGCAPACTLGAPPFSQPGSEFIQLGAILLLVGVGAKVILHPPQPAEEDDD